jgi:ATP-dependent Clp protease ATP-binding subunit ClpC
VYERFTDRARKVMQLANQEALRLNHESVGTEHILLGLLKEGGGVAANVLKNLEIDFRVARLEVEKVVPAGRERVRVCKLPMTPPAKKAIEYAVEEARGLGHHCVGTEHLLLGLLREQEGVAGLILIKLGAGTTRLRSEVMALLGGEVPDDIDELADAEFDALPPGVRQALDELNRQIGRLQWDKEEAVANQQFEAAAALQVAIRKLTEQKRTLAASDGPVDDRIKRHSHDVRERGE